MTSSCSLSLSECVRALPLQLREFARVCFFSPTHELMKLHVLWGDAHEQCETIVHFTRESHHLDHGGGAADCDTHMRSQGVVVRQETKDKVKIS